jgi:hypothetical protein
MCPSGGAAYYELHVAQMGETTQWGFCTEAFKGQGAENVDLVDGGIEDDESSWGIDGHRLLKWHEDSSSFGGRKWQNGDVIGLACDLRVNQASSKAGVEDSDSNNGSVEDSDSFSGTEVHLQVEGASGCP